MTQQKNSPLKQSKSLGKFYRFWEMNVNPITMKDSDYIVERSKDYR